MYDMHDQMVNAAGARRAALLCGAAMLLANAGAARAYQVLDGGDTPQIEEITVTAQKREQLSQDVPVSVTVTTGETIADLNITSLPDLTRREPAVVVTQSGRSDRFFIRGVGSANNASVEQSVGTFIDGIYHGRSRSSTATFLDLDRVEVLKGPQSIYFGNSSIAGALNIITKKPSKSPEGYVRALYGTDDEYQVEVAAGTPLTDTLRARAAFTANGMGGYLNDKTAGHKVPKTDNLGGRVTLVWEPTDRFDATLKGEITRNKNEGGFPFQPTNCPPSAPFTAPRGFCNTLIALGVETELNNSRSFNDGPGSILKTYEAVLTMNYELGDHVLTSVTGYSKFNQKLDLDLDQTPQTLLNVETADDYEQLSQELRIASPTGQTLEYIGGLYYQWGKIRAGVDTGFFFLTPIAQGIPAFAALVPVLPLGQHNFFDQTDNNYAAFGALTWNISDRLRATAGLRWTRVEKDFVQTNYYGTAPSPFGTSVPYTGATAALAQAFANAAGRLGVAGVIPLSRRDQDLTPSVNVQYDIADDVMAYASYSEGFKAGGFNGADISGVAAQLPFAPEHVKAYEAGIKSRLFDRRLLLNLVGFYSDYKDLQVSSSILQGNALITRINNAGASVSKGIEAEVQFAVSDELKVGANATYLDAYFKRYPNAAATATQMFLNPAQTSQDAAGLRPNYSPKFSGNFYAEYTQPVGNGLEVSAEIVTFMSSRYTLADNYDPKIAQNSYAKIDGRLTLGREDGAWDISLIGKNLNNKTIRIFGTNLNTSPGTYVFQKERPRSVAVQLRYRW